MSWDSLSLRSLALVLVLFPLLNLSSAELLGF